MDYVLVVPAAVRESIEQYLHARFADDDEAWDAAADAIERSLLQLERSPSLGARIPGPLGNTRRRWVFEIDVEGVLRAIMVTYSYDEDAETTAPLILTSLRPVAM